MCLLPLVCFFSAVRFLRKLKCMGLLLSPDEEGGPGREVRREVPCTLRRSAVCWPRRDRDGCSAVEWQKGRACRWDSGTWCSAQDLSLPCHFDGLELPADRRVDAERAREGESGDEIILCSPLTIADFVIHLVALGKAMRHGVAPGGVCRHIGWSQELHPLAVTIETPCRGI